MYKGLRDGGIPVLQPVLGTALSTAGGISTAAIAGTSLAVPIIGAAIAGVTLAVGLFMNRLGPKQKVYTTKIVNDAEPLLQSNLDAWRASAHHTSEQQTALANFDQVWQAVVAACDRPELGDPGQNCINDRKRGSTKGYDWFALYRDPIANDMVAPDPVVDMFAGVDGAFSSLTSALSPSGGGGSIAPLLIGGLLLLILAVD